MIILIRNFPCTREGTKQAEFEHAIPQTDAPVCPVSMMPVITPAKCER